MRKVRDIMSAAPVCMAPGESVSAAARAMKQQGIGTVLVLTDGMLTGLVTDRDITVRVLAENRDPQTTPIGDICSSQPVVLGPDDDLAQAVRTAVINKRAGGMGLIVGRKSFQRPLAEGAALIHAVQDVYLSKDVTIA